MGFRVAAISVIILLLMGSIIRDLQLIKFFPGDMRNRIVGARLQKDHKSPYFYRWQLGDGARYYNPYGFDSFAASPSTASPFYHLLLYPLTEYPQITINKIWLVLQYTFWSICVCICLKMSCTLFQKTGVLIAATVFLFTEGWISLIYFGQLYLIVPFLGITFLYCIRNNNRPVYITIAGIIFIIAVLIRPNFILFFLPFLLLHKKYSLKYKLLFFTPAIILLACILSSSAQRNLWKDYKRNIDEQIKISYTGNPTMQINAADPHYMIFEGIDMYEIQKKNSRLITDNWQNVSFFLLVRDIFHTKLSVQMLIGLFFLLALVMCSGYYFYNQTKNWNIYSLALLGFCLYMLCDIFSPIPRYQYYAVQWLFPLLVAATIFTPRFWKLYVLLALALLLNIINSPFIKMEHTIGEYLFLISFFCLTLSYTRLKQNI